MIEFVLKNLAIFIIVGGLLILTATIIIVFKVIKWDRTPPLATLTPNDVGGKIPFHIEKVKPYWICLRTKRGLNFKRLFSHKLIFEISDSQGKSIPVTTDVMFFNEIRGFDIRHTNFVVGKFQVDTQGIHYVTLLSKEGTESADKFFITPTLRGA